MYTMPSIIISTELFNVLNGEVPLALNSFMGKLKRTGNNRAQVFNSESGRILAISLFRYKVKLPNLKLEFSLQLH